MRKTQAKASKKRVSSYQGNVDFQGDVGNTCNDGAVGNYIDFGPHPPRKTVYFGNVTPPPVYHIILMALLHDMGEKMDELKLLVERAFDAAYNRTPLQHACQSAADEIIALLADSAPNAADVLPRHTVSAIIYKHVHNPHVK